MTTEKPATPSRTMAIVAASIIALLAATAHAADPREEARAHHQAGIREYRQKRFPQAVIEFEKAFAIHPHPTLLFNIAQAHRYGGSFHQAILYYKRYLEMAPNAADRQVAEKHIAELQGRVGTTGARRGKPAAGATGSRRASAGAPGAATAANAATGAASGNGAAPPVGAATAGGPATPVGAATAGSAAPPSGGAPGAMVPPGNPSQPSTQPGATASHGTAPGGGAAGAPPPAGTAQNASAPGAPIVASAGTPTGTVAPAEPGWGPPSGDVGGGPQPDTQYPTFELATDANVEAAPEDELHEFEPESVIFAPKPSGNSGRFRMLGQGGLAFGLFSHGSAATGSAIRDSRYFATALSFLYDKPVGPGAFEIGGMLTWSPVSYVTKSSSSGGQTVFSHLAGGFITAGWRFGDSEFSLGPALSLGMVWWTGLTSGNPFTVEAKASGAVAMPTIRLAAPALWRSRKLLFGLEPALSYAKPNSSQLSKRISAFTTVAVSAVVGYEF